MPNEDLADIFNTFLGLTATQVQIKLILAQKNKMKSFTQWLKDRFILSIDPTTLPFPQADTAELLIQSKTHQLFVYKSDTLCKAANAVRLMKQVKWGDWAPTFMNYVRAIPGRDGVPLKNIIRYNDFANLTPNNDFLDECVDNSRLQGESFIIELVEVHTFVVNFISRSRKKWKK